VTVVIEDPSGVKMSNDSNFIVVLGKMEKCHDSKEDIRTEARVVLQVTESLVRYQGIAPSKRCSYD
jgi:hypothetical protein